MRWRSGARNETAVAAGAAAESEVSVDDGGTGMGGGTGGCGGGGGGCGCGAGGAGGHGALGKTGIGGGMAPGAPEVDLTSEVPLAEAAFALAGGAPLTPAVAAELAEREGVSLARVYAAAGLHPQARFERREPVVFVACSGGCRLRGSVELVEHLLGRRDARRREGRPGFDVATRVCLDRCEIGPNIAVFTPDGAGLIPGATPERLDHAIEGLVDAPRREETAPEASA